MQSGMFTSAPLQAEQAGAPGQPRESGARRLSKPDYSKSQAGIAGRAVSFAIGFAIGFVILFVYYKTALFSLVCGAAFGIVYIFIAERNVLKKRKRKLRTQFFDLLEAVSVAMRAGNPPAKALKSARADLLLLYSETSDIIIELDIIIAMFDNAVPLSESFLDFAERSGLEDIESFATIYKTIEGKASRADEIVRQTQSIIADKMEIEMEIETLMTAAKNEMNVMTLMPIIILLIMGYSGGGFMDAIYTTIGGKIAATAGLLIFILSIVIGRKTGSVKL
jgi:tight adherence protein B